MAQFFYLLNLLQKTIATMLKQHTHVQHNKLFKFEATLRLQIAAYNNLHYGTQRQYILVKKSSERIIIV